MVFLMFLHSSFSERAQFFHSDSSEAVALYNEGEVEIQFAVLIDR